MKRKSIPSDLRARLSKEPRMYKCCVADRECEGRIQWHHALRYGGQSVQAFWCIVGICEYHHIIADRKDIRKKIVSIMRVLGGNDVKDFEKVQKLR